MRQKKNNILIVLLCGFIVLIIVWWNKQMNRYERPKGLTSYETVEQFIKAMNAGNVINGFLEQEVNDKGSSDVQFVDVTIERVKEDDEMAEYHVVMTEVHKKTHQETLTDWRVILKKDLLSGEWMITSYGEG